MIINFKIQKSNSTVVAWFTERLLCLFSAYLQRDHRASGHAEHRYPWVGLSNPVIPVQILVALYAKGLEQCLRVNPFVLFYLNVSKSIQIYLRKY